MSSSAELSQLNAVLVRIKDRAYAAHEFEQNVVGPLVRSSRSNQPVRSKEADVESARAAGAVMGGVMFRRRLDRTLTTIGEFVSYVNSFTDASSIGSLQADLRNSNHKPDNSFLHDFRSELPGLSGLGQEAKDAAEVAAVTSWERTREQLQPQIAELDNLLPASIPAAPKLFGGLFGKKEELTPPQRTQQCIELLKGKLAVSQHELDPLLRFNAEQAIRQDADRPASQEERSAAWITSLEAPTPKLREMFATELDTMEREDVAGLLQNVADGSEIVQAQKTYFELEVAARVVNRGI